MPEELWTEVHTGGNDQNHPQEKKKCKKAKWLSEEGLQNICEKKRSERQRRKRKIYPFECRVTRTAMRDKKAFLSDQYRMGNARDLFKNISYTKGTFHAKMGTIKDRSGMDLTEEKMLRRGSKNTQNYAKKIFMIQVITMV